MPFERWFSISSPEEAVSQRLGGMYAAELPDPISNSEVKRGRADDSLVHASAKVGSCPFNKKTSLTGVFLIYVQLNYLLIEIII